MTTKLDAIRARDVAWEVHKNGNPLWASPNTIKAAMQAANDRRYLLALVDEMAEALRRIISNHTSSHEVPGAHIWSRYCDRCNFEDIAKAALARLQETK